jgi:ArsR family transcriptional regulator
MASITNVLRVLADPLRLRIFLILREEELSVAELQEVFSTGQSRISTGLAQLKKAELVEDRRAGKSVYYRATAQFADIADRAAREIDGVSEDRHALLLIRKKRADKTRAYFDQLAGKFGREYLPGRSWKGLAEALLLLMPPMVIADLGAGEGTFTQLMARKAQKVIAVDNSVEMVKVGAALAAEHGLENVEFRLGDLEAPPIEPESVDLAFFSQSLHHAQQPQEAVNAAFRLLKPEGRIAVLDLKRHGFEEARELYADRWLGFSEAELDRFLRTAGFGRVEIATVHREEESPHFETLLAVGHK